MENKNADVAVDDLTQAEKDLIIAQRNKKAAEDAEKVAKQNLEKAGKIEKMKQLAKEFSIQKNQLKSAYQNVLAELNYNQPNGYKLIATPASQYFEATNGAWSSEAKVIYDKMTVEYSTYEIHSTRQLSTDSYRQVYITVSFEDGAYRLSIHGVQDNDRHYKKVTTVIEKINSFFTAHDNEILRKQRATTLAERALVAVQKKHPEATVTAEHQDHYREARRYRRELYATTNYICAKFPNDATISYLYSERDGEVELKVYTYNLSSIDQDAILNFLITAPKKPTK